MKKECCNLEHVSASPFNCGFTRCKFSDYEFDIFCDGDAHRCAAEKEYLFECEAHVNVWTKRLNNVKKAIKTRGE